jgi:GrpB-like predicted nucleotidyltransferase (UPF0157 family)
MLIHVGVSRALVARAPVAAEIRIFRDWLRAHPDDRSRYAEIKLLAAEQTRATGGHTTDYNATKESVIREIYARTFRASGLLEGLAVRALACRP